MIEHRNVISRLQWLQDTFTLSNQDVVCNQTSISFDVSVEEIFWPLSNGSKIIIASSAVQKDSLLRLNADLSGSISSSLAKYPLFL